MTDWESKLQQTKRLLDLGLIEKAEYDAVKAEMLRSMGVYTGGATPTTADPLVGATRIGGVTPASSTDTLGGVTRMDRVFAESTDTLGGVTRMFVDTGSGIGQYKILGEIGKGGMGSVYRARHSNEEFAKHTGDVAIKVMNLGLSEDSGFVSRFMAEAGLGRSIRHPNFVAIHDVIGQENSVALVMDLVEGRPLSKIIDKKAIDLPKALPIIEALCGALDYLHGKGIVHRDLKPDNIIITPSGAPVILDLGIAKNSNQSDSSQTSTGLAMGTPLYMAPEQLDAKNVTGSADRYALGLIVYEMLSGRLPWEEGLGQGAILSRKFSGDLDSLDSHPKHIQDAVFGLLRAKEKDRWTSCAEFLEALKKDKPISSVVSGSSKVSSTASPVELSEEEEIQRMYEELKEKKEAEDRQRRLREEAQKRIEAEEEAKREAKRQEEARIRAEKEKIQREAERIRQEEERIRQEKLKAQREAEQLEKEKKEAEDKRKREELEKAQKEVAEKKRQEEERIREAKEKAQREAERLEKEKKEAEDKRKQEKLKRFQQSILDEGTRQQSVPRSEIVIKRECGGFFGFAKTIVEYPMVKIPSGWFMMGALEWDGDADNAEKPHHQVSISRSMYVGKYPVTQGLYESVVGSNPSRFRGATRPVESVSWYDAVSFCNKLSELEGREPVYTINGYDVSCHFGAKGYRLLTEAEWEYCARSGQRFKYSGSDNVDEVAWYSRNSRGETHPVGLKKPNGFGLYDMSGNVFEWVWDWKGEYRSSTQVDPQGSTSGSDCVYRGGSWYSSARYVRVSYRIDGTPTNTFDFLGFRLGLPL